MTLQQATASGQNQNDHYIGIDLGTSGARISVISNNGIKSARVLQGNGDDDTDKDENYVGASSSTMVPPPSFHEVFSTAILWGSKTVHEGNETQSRHGPYDDPNAWCHAVEDLLEAFATSSSAAILATVRSICISGTSASCLLVEPLLDPSDTTSQDGPWRWHTVQPTRKPRMYNFNIPNDNNAMLQLQKWVPDRHTAQSTTGSLAKLLDWHCERPLSVDERLCHQADFVTCQFLAISSDNSSINIASDWHNCLKLGYNVQTLQWPSWLLTCLEQVGLSAEIVLPGRVISPGTTLGVVRPDLAARFGLPTTTALVGGTTDSNAAFLAATQGFGATPGTAVTSLGSTLAIKQLSTVPVEDASLGVYSHRFPTVFESSDEAHAQWLVGGASNVGCAVLRELEFTNDELDRLSLQIDPAVDSPLSYYPLSRKGERFPVADSTKEPILSPVPENRAEFLHGILQGISDVERNGFLALGALGASPAAPNRVWTCGGGSRNEMWNQLRQRRLRESFPAGSSNDAGAVTVERADHVEASYGAAILAAASFVSI